jgi:gliding motility-associated-like protein
LDAASLTGGNTINATTGAVTYSASWSGTTTITASAAGCNGPAETTLVVNSLQQATANAGLDAISCQGQSFTVPDATALNYSAVLWTSTGTGTLQNASTLNPTYIPQPGETGNVLLTLTATGISGCVSASDPLLLTIIPVPIALAGPDATICENQSYSTANATAAYYNSMLWSTSGTGTFTNPTQLNTYYIPGTADVTNGSVVLTLTSFGTSPCGNTTDNLTLTIQKAPLAFAGSDQSTCQGIPITLSGASAANYTALLWTHTGLGTITGSNTLTPTYIPTVNETGIVVMTLTATGNSACGSSSSTMNLRINPTPTSNAGNDNSSCGQTPFILTNPTATGIGTLLWTSSGTGIFTDPSVLNATFIPSVADVASGSVILTLATIGLVPCGTVSDNMTLALTAAPSANAGPDRTSCNSASFTIENATASAYSTLEWTHNGLGTLSGANTLTPVYTPSVGESGSILFTLTLTGNSPCGTVSDNMLLTLNPAIAASAGNNLEICEMLPVTISGASAQHYSSVLWTTSGTGIFNDPTLVNPAYNSSLSDANAGTVTLTMQVSGIAPCVDFSDPLTLTIAKAPLASAGNDAIICNGTPYILANTSAANYTSLLWEYTPTGSGTFTNVTSLIPTFMPAPGFTGSVKLTMKAYGNPICSSFVVNDDVMLNVIQGITANAGNDQLISAGSVTILHGTVADGSGSFAWSWEPASLLESNNVPEPVTLPINLQTTFTLSVLDISTGCSSQDETVVSVGLVNHPPLAVDDHDTLSTNISGSINLVINDSDPDGDPLSISICGNPANGSIVINEDNTITYTPNISFIGDDQFCYLVCDNGNPALCDSAVVYIHIKSKIDDLIIYNLLTPNGDNSNDIWRIGGIEDHLDNTVMIFNRWGDKILNFSRYDNKNVFWDGTNSKGKILPSGTYFFILTIKDEGTRTGWIYIRGKEGE